MAQRTILAASRTEDDPYAGRSRSRRFMTTPCHSEGPLPPSAATAVYEGRLVAIVRQVSIRGNQLDPDLGADLELAPRAHAVLFGADKEARRTLTERLALGIIKRQG